MRTDWRLVALLYIAGLLAAGQFAKVALTLDGLSAVYPGAGASLPLAVSALSVMGVIFGATAGALAARIGLRPVLLAGVLGTAGLSAAQALLPPFPVFLAMRFLEGAAHLAIVVTAPTLLAMSSAPRAQAAVMGLWGTFFGVGFALTAFAVPALTALGGASVVYLAHGAALLLLAVPLYLTVPSVPPAAPHDGGWMARHVSIYLTPSVIAPAIGFFWHTIMFLGLLTFLPDFLGAWTAPILPLLALIGTLAAGALARAIAPRRILYWAYALTILTAAALPFLPDPAFLPVAFIFLVILGLPPGAAFAAVPAYNEPVADRSRANGAIAQLGNVGTAISVPLVALTLPFGVAGPLALSAFIAAVGWVAVAAIHGAMDRRASARGTA